MVVHANLYRISIGFAMMYFGGVRSFRCIISRSQSSLRKPFSLNLAATDSSDQTADSQESFIFGSNPLNFADLGIHPDLSTALSNSGKVTATAIQAKTYQKVLDGIDVIIAAETGSGKTLSYSLPLLQLCMEKKARSRYPRAVILVPNKELCRQVLSMTSAIAAELKTLDHHVTVDTLSGGNGQQWPYPPDEGPDIVVCTPGILSKFVRGQIILNEELFHSIKHLVLDEADMLLEGSYLIETEKILDALKTVRRSMIRNGELKVHESSCQFILAAATLPSSGMRSIEKYIEKRFPNAVTVSTEHLHKFHPRIEQTFIQVSSNAPEAVEDRLSLLVEAIVTPAPVEEQEEGGEGGADHLEAHATPATTSGAAENGEENVAAPETSTFITDEIYNSLEQTMIFVNTAEAAEWLGARLDERGLRCAQFHKLVEFRSKAQQLRAFQASEVKLLVCTDHAARGLDLPQVRHVIQAEFATNVVQYLHRIGRASRAGRVGRATNFYDDGSVDLVNTLLAATAADGDGSLDVAAGAEEEEEGGDEVLSPTASGRREQPQQDQQRREGEEEVRDRLLSEKEEPGKVNSVETLQQEITTSPAEVHWEDLDDLRDLVTGPDEVGTLGVEGGAAGGPAEPKRWKRVPPQPIEPGRIDHAFSRRRGFRQKIKKTAKRVAASGGQQQEGDEPLG